MLFGHWVVTGHCAGLILGIIGLDLVLDIL